MTSKILVPVRRSDLIEDLIPYIEDIARPGMQIVFLVDVRLNGFEELADQSLAIRTGLCPALLPRRSSRTTICKDHAQRAKQRVLNACDKLRKRELEICVNIYAGSLRRAVRDYTRDEEVRVIMMHPTVGNRVIRFLEKLFPLPRYFEPAALPQVLFVRSGKNNLT